jgi:hypothetical protein
MYVYAGYDCSLLSFFYYFEVIFFKFGIEM